MGPSPKARAAVAFIAAIATFLISTAQAATPIEQNRDEPGRNPYQQLASKGCNTAKTCTLTFPAVAKSERLVVEYISCLIVSSSYTGVTAKLYAASKPTVYAAFFPGQFNTGPTYNPINSPTLVYVNGGDAPAVSLTGNDPLSGTESCFLSGYTVTLP
jgi:hypothetical protein